MKDDVYRIVEEAISPDALHEIVRDDSDGAVVTFAGVVRDNSRGRRTEYLVYDAYGEMAEKKMREIGEEIRARWHVVRVAVLHRIGRLEIGEISVLIAVSSAHREPAFEACRYLIDRLKETVPIWKKEVWTDGEAWIEGEAPAPPGSAKGT
jgi:molybdopterin synthase catalytic subunit